MDLFIIQIKIRKQITEEAVAKLNEHITLMDPLQEWLQTIELKVKEKMCLIAKSEVELQAQLQDVQVSIYTIQTNQHDTPSTTTFYAVMIYIFLTRTVLPKSHKKPTM